MTTTARRTITLTLPLPPAVLSPNARVHWAVRAKAAREYREHCSWLVLSEMRAHGWQALGPVMLSLAFVYCRQPQDQDNAVASIKHGLDGIVAAGLLSGDGPAHVTLGSVVTRRAPHRHQPGGACPAGVIVTLREVES